MNAYELADEFKNRNWDEVDCVLWCEKSANMLRQQADRIGVLEANHAIQKNINDKALQYIAQLEKDLALKTRDRNVFCDFTLAYEKRIEELEKLEQDFIRVIKQTNPNKPQTKPLSDDEIYEMYAGPVTSDKEMVDFARAIEERHGIK